MKRKIFMWVGYITIELIILFVAGIIGMSSYNAMINVSVDSLFWSIVAWFNAVVCVGFMFLTWFVSYAFSNHFIQKIKEKDTVD